MFHVKPRTILAFSVVAVAVAAWYFRKPKDKPFHGELADKLILDTIQEHERLINRPPNNLT